MRKLSAGFEGLELILSRWIPICGPETSGDSGVITVRGSLIHISRAGIAQTLNKCVYHMYLSYRLYWTVGDRT